MTVQLTQLPILATVVGLTTFCGLLLHLRWDRPRASAERLGALPLEDCTPAAHHEEVDRVR